MTVGYQKALYTEAPRDIVVSTITSPSGNCRIAPSERLVKKLDLTGMTAAYVPVTEAADRTTAVPRLIIRVL